MCLTESAWLSAAARRDKRHIGSSRVGFLERLPRTPGPVRTVGRISGRNPIVIPPSATGLLYVTSQEFLADVDTFANKWDREWIRYFYLHDDRSYFHSYATNSYRLPITPDEVAAFAPMDSLTRRLDEKHAHTTLQVLLPGSDLVDRDVFEMGCGVGMLGRILGHLARSYVGYDYSPFALYAARLMSPKRCQYIQAGDVEDVRRLYESADTCLGRHFFIHNNFNNAQWVLRMLRDIVRPGGIIHADLFRADKPAERILPAKSDLLERAASAGFYYTRSEIEELAEACGLEVQSITEVEVPPRVYVNFARV